MWWVPSGSAARASLWECRDRAGTTAWACCRGSGVHGCTAAGGSVAAEGVGAPPLLLQLLLPLLRAAAARGGKASDAVGVSGSIVSAAVFASARGELAASGHRRRQPRTAARSAITGVRAASRSQRAGRQASKRVSGAPPMPCDAKGAAALPPCTLMAAGCDGIQAYQRKTGVTIDVLLWEGCAVGTQCTSG